jgi:hypothetical protein
VRFPRLRLRLWVVMVMVAVCAGVSAEMSQRRERLARLCVAQHQRADVCFHRIGPVCKLGETSASIEASYRRKGPSALQVYRAALNHLALAREYDVAANRRWLAMLSYPPPLHGFSDIRSLAEWGLEALAEFAPLLAVGILFPVLRLDRYRSERKW